MGELDAHGMHRATCEATCRTWQAVGQLMMFQRVSLSPHTGSILPPGPI